MLYYENGLCSNGYFRIEGCSAIGKRWVCLKLKKISLNKYEIAFGCDLKSNALLCSPTELLLA